MVYAALVLWVSLRAGCLAGAVVASFVFPREEQEALWAHVPKPCFPLGALRQGQGAFVSWKLLVG